MAKRGRPRRVQPSKTTPVRGAGGDESVNRGQDRATAVLEDLNGDALIDNEVIQDRDLPLGEGCARGGRAVDRAAWGDCEEVSGLPYLRAVQKESLADCEIVGPCLKEMVSGGSGLGGSQNGMPCSSIVHRGVTVRTKIDGEWQEVVGKRQGMGAGLTKGVGKYIAMEAGTRFAVLQPYHENDFDAVGDGGISFVKSNDVRDERVPPNKESHDYRSLEC
ncbi:hypothetical protein Dimus_018434 [Dionaea muscipula]